MFTKKLFGVYKVSNRPRCCVRQLGVFKVFNSRFSQVWNITSQPRHENYFDYLKIHRNRRKMMETCRNITCKQYSINKCDSPGTEQIKFHDPSKLRTPYHSDISSLGNQKQESYIHDVIPNFNIIVQKQKVNVNAIAEEISPLKNIKTDISYYNNNNSNLILSYEHIDIKETLNQKLQNKKENYFSNEIVTFPNTDIGKAILQDKDLKNCLSRLYSINPVNQMLVFFQRVSSYLNCESLIDKPKYTKDKYFWTCTYSVKWPEVIDVSAKSHSKKDASYRAAQYVLMWLTKIGKINNKGKLMRSDLNSLGNGPLCYLNKNNVSLLQTRSFSTSSYKLNKQTTVEDTSNIQADAKDKNEDYNVHVASLKKQFAAPKNVLHNVFNIISTELKQKDLKLEPQYKLIKHSQNSSSWMCLYRIKWPEQIDITKLGHTKQEASYLAALSALAWLKSKNKITDTGMPLIYDKEKAKEVMKSIAKSITLNRNVKENLHEIVNIFSDKFLPSIEADNANLDGLNSTVNEDQPIGSDNINLSKLHKQNYLGLNCYLAREPVKLPVSNYKNEFIDLLGKKQVIIIKGEPGCGKSTRIPQYVLEAWAKEDGLDGKPCRIAVTQPRRIAALSLAQRVASERQEPVGNIVGYQVRLKSNFNQNRGRILYCTTGILLRHIQNDPKLSGFTHILLDEAHERDVNTDLLMNLLRFAVKSNPDLKVIVMSATIDTSMFQQYFDNAHVMHIPGFTYPVKVNFLDDSTNYDKTKQMCEGAHPTVVHEDVVGLINFIHRKRKEGAILCFLPGWEDIKKIRNLLPRTNDMSVLCLHSRLQDDEQYKIFSNPPPGVRKVILATNIAETSVTIDDVVYVIDTGIHKEERFDADKGIMCIDNHWISKASMKQRKGRAGRCQEGESFHMYKKSKFEEFEDFSMPEILRTSLTKILLDSKVYSNNMNANEFLGQLPSPPEKSAIARAVADLRELELLDDSENLTSLGRTLSEFQLEPKLSKAMVNSVIFKCATPVVDIVTLFSGQSELFSSGLIDKEGVKRVKAKYSPNSDHLALMRIFEEWLLYFESGDERKMNSFCYENNLLSYKLATIQKLRDIHYEYIEKGLSNVLPISDDHSDNDELVRAVLLSGVNTVLQHNSWDIVKGRMKNVNVFLTRHNQRASITTESVNSRRGKFSTDFLLYINETQSNIRRSTIIRETSLISPLAVLLFKNNNLRIENIPAEKFSNLIKSNDQVLVKLLGSKINFICDREDAVLLSKCKEALKSGMQYYISKLTQKKVQLNPEANKHWDDILSTLDNMFSRRSY